MREQGGQPSRETTEITLFIECLHITPAEASNNFADIGANSFVGRSLRPPISVRLSTLMIEMILLLLLNEQSIFAYYGGQTYQARTVEFQVMLHDS